MGKSGKRHNLGKKEILLHMLQDAAEVVHEEILQKCGEAGFVPKDGDVFAGQAVASMLWERIGFGQRIVNDIDVFRVKETLEYHQERIVEYVRRGSQEDIFHKDDISIESNGYGNLFAVEKKRFTVVSSERKGLLNIVEVAAPKEAYIYQKDRLFELIIESFDINSVQAGISAVDGKLFVSDQFLEFLMTKEMFVTSYHTPPRTISRMASKFSEYKEAGIEAYLKKEEFLKLAAAKLLINKLSRITMRDFNKMCRAATATSEGKWKSVERNGVPHNVALFLDWVARNEKMTFMMPQENYDHELYREIGAFLDIENIDKEEQKIKIVKLAESIAKKTFHIDLNIDREEAKYLHMLAYSIDETTRKGALPDLKDRTEAERFFISMALEYPTLHFHLTRLAIECVTDRIFCGRESNSMVEALNKLNSFLFERRIFFMTEEQEESVEKFARKAIEEAKNSSLYKAIEKLGDKMQDNPYILAVKLMEALIDEEDVSEIWKIKAELNEISIATLVSMVFNMRYVSSKKADELANLYRKIVLETDVPEFGKIFYIKGAVSENMKQIRSVDFDKVFRSIKMLTEHSRMKDYSGSLSFRDLQFFYEAVHLAAEKIKEKMGVSMKEAKNIMMGIMENYVENVAPEDLSSFGLNKAAIKEKVEQSETISIDPSTIFQIFVSKDENLIKEAIGKTMEIMESNEVPKVRIIEKEMTFSTTDGQTVTIKPLLSKVDLIQEGSEMSNCVGGYGLDGMNAFFSAWIGPKKKNSRFTVRLYKLCKHDECDLFALGEVRGFANRSLKPEEAETLTYAFSNITEISPSEFFYFAGESEKAREIAAKNGWTLTHIGSETEKRKRKCLFYEEDRKKDTIPEISIEEDDIPF